MRIAHATDIHWFAPPSVSDLELKRLIGTADLYLRGRRHSFDPTVQRELVAHLKQLKPDLVLITGDLTAQGLDTEFAIARAALDPLLVSVPALILPGNHDVYTPGAARRGTFRTTFAAHGGDRDPSGLVRVDLGHVTLLGLDPNRPAWVRSTGRVPDAQLAALASALADPTLAGQTVILGTHYPPVDRHGAPYTSRLHGLANVSALVEVLTRAPHRPALVACGHVHLGFRAPLALGDGTRIPVVNCGSSGYAHQPRRGRCAATALYDIRPDGTISFERHLHDGRTFAPEAGGAWHSGH